MNTDNFCTSMTTSHDTKSRVIEKRKMWEWEWKISYFKIYYSKKKKLKLDRMERNSKRKLEIGQYVAVALQKIVEMIRSIFIT